MTKKEREYKKWILNQWKITGFLLMGHLINILSYFYLNFDFWYIPFLILFLYNGYLGSQFNDKKEDFQRQINKEKEKIENKRYRESYNRERKSKQNQLNKLKESIVQHLKKVDEEINSFKSLKHDVDGFNLMVEKNQNILVEKSKEFNDNYTLKFVKVGNFLQTKQKNILSLKTIMYDCRTKSDFNKLSELLDREICSFKLLVYKSLNLLSSLLDDNQVIFYRIHEELDKFNIFNSNWENEVSDKLSRIDNNLINVISEIQSMSLDIVNSIDELSYITNESSQRLEYRLQELNSSIKTNNLISIINTYQNYRTNKRLM